MSCPTQFTHFHIINKGEVNFFHAGNGLVKIPIMEIPKINEKMGKEKPKGWFEATCMLERATSEHSRFFPEHSPSPR